MAIPKKNIKFKGKSQQNRKKRLLLHPTFVYSTIQMKKHLFYAFLFLFVITAIVTLLGITEVITIRDQYLIPLCTSLLIELAGAVIALYRGAKFFDEPLHAEHEHLSTSAKSPAAHVAVSPAATIVLMPKSQPPITTAVLTPLAVDASELDLAEFFVKYDQLEHDGRFLERDKLKAKIKGKRVVFRGMVYDVSDIDGKPNVFLRSAPFKLQAVIFLVGESQRADAYSLRKGDMLEVRGIAATGGVTYIGIENGSFMRMGRSRSNSPARQI